MKETRWSVYMTWTDNTFIELFYIPNAKIKRVDWHGDKPTIHWRDEWRWEEY